MLCNNVILCAILQVYFCQWWPLSVIGLHDMPTSTNSTGPIMDVWQNNLDVEMAKIRSVVQQYPYIAMVN